MPKDELFLSQQTLVDLKKRKSYVKILSFLYESGADSISKLSENLNASVPSITALVTDLVSQGWLSEQGATKTKSGRRPIFYDLNPKKKITLVVDVNIYDTNLCLVDLHNHISQKEHFKISIDDPEYFLILQEKITAFLGNKQKPWAIGISAPGLIEDGTGINYSHPNINYNDKSLGANLTENFKLPVFCLNDTRAALLGEHHFGLAKNKKNVLLVNLDWGIGLGILLNGNIVKGSKGIAGEIGHVQAYPDGELCLCGKVGCFETVASARALLSKAKSGVKEGKTTILNQIKRDLELSDIIDAAVSGDQFCIEIIYEIGHELGKGLSTAVLMFNPESIIIDGILKNAGELIVSTIKQGIHKYCLAPFRDLEVLVSPLSEEAKIFGTKSYVFLHMMELYGKG